MCGLSDTCVYTYIDGTEVVREIDEDRVGRVIGKCVNKVWKLYVPVAELKRDLLDWMYEKGKIQCTK